MCVSVFVCALAWYVIWIQRSATKSETLLGFSKSSRNGRSLQIQILPTTTTMTTTSTTTTIASVAAAAVIMGVLIKASSSWEEHFHSLMFHHAQTIITTLYQKGFSLFVLGRSSRDSSSPQITWHTLHFRPYSERLKRNLDSSKKEYSRFHAMFQPLRRYWRLCNTKNNIIIIIMPFCCIMTRMLLLLVMLLLHPPIMLKFKHVHDMIYISITSINFTSIYLSYSCIFHFVSYIILISLFRVNLFSNIKIYFKLWFGPLIFENRLLGSWFFFTNIKLLIPKMLSVGTK